MVQPSDLYFLHRLSARRMFFVSSSMLFLLSAEWWNKFLSDLDNEVTMWAYNNVAIDSCDNARCVEQLTAWTNLWLHGASPFCCSTRWERFFVALRSRGGRCCYWMLSAEGSEGVATLHEGQLLLLLSRRCCRFWVWCSFVEPPIRSLGLIEVSDLSCLAKVKTTNDAFSVSLHNITSLLIGWMLGQVCWQLDCLLGQFWQHSGWLLIVFHLLRWELSCIDKQCTIILKGNGCCAMLGGELCLDGFDREIMWIDLIEELIHWISIHC